MATSGGYIRAIFGNPAVSYKASAAEIHGRIRKRICKVCDMNPGEYDEAHYDLAEEWFRYHDYLEYTARVFMLSASYHRWWNQQLAQVESEFLSKHPYHDLSPDRFRDLLFEAIITMNVHPPAELRRVMHNEGAALLKANPELSEIKMYRDGKNA
jgi:hypothetical protein